MLRHGCGFRGEAQTRVRQPVRRPEPAVEMIFLPQNRCAARDRGERLRNRCAARSPR